jgi:hypothetical protein
VLADVDKIWIRELQLVHRNVTEDNQFLTFGLDEDTRVTRGVSGRRHKPHAGRNLELAVDEDHRAGVTQRLDAVAQVRPLRERLFGHEVRPFGVGDDVAGVRKETSQPTWST